MHRAVMRACTKELCHELYHSRAVAIHTLLVGRRKKCQQACGAILTMQLYPAARVVRKDPSHARAVVMRFAEDGDLMWQPVDKVWAWIEVCCFCMATQTFMTNDVAHQI